jgi:hypothetical protein
MDFPDRVPIAPSSLGAISAWLQGFRVGNLWPRNSSSPIGGNVQLLFSYGTLRLESVQRASFGRRLVGSPDSLPGYVLRTVEITDAEVLAASGERFHPIVLHTGNPDDVVEGSAFEVSPEELRAADGYEVADYRRVRASLDSGRDARVYVARESSSPSG